MVAMNTPATKLPSLSTIRNDYSQFSFHSADNFYWSPRENTIYYKEGSLSSGIGFFQLFHELGHACCGHTTFHSGIELLRIEAQAWQKATEIAKLYKIKIEATYIEQALDSYRDWLHQRSICPQCDTVSTETAPHQYHCFSCTQNWSVPDHQQTRRYRRKVA